MESLSEQGIEGASTDPMCPIAHRVVSVVPETDDIYTLRLHPEETRRGTAFKPGQFNMLYAFGVGECAISISGDPALAAYTDHTIRNVGTVSGALVGVQEGDVIGVRGPFGTPWPVDQASGRDLLLIAGGIGLAPLRPVIKHVLAKRDACKSLTILTGARDPAGIVFRDELLAYNDYVDVDSKVSVDHADRRWKGNVGVVTSLVKRSVTEAANTLAFVCGPEVMMRYAVMELHQVGLKDHQIFLSLERNMKCAIGFCGHCQFGPEFICRDGPVFRYDRIAYWLHQREV